jgi:predicted AAA+ superfamily ATPase
VYELDRPGALQIADADPDRLTTGPSPILIDEWQRLPLVWDLVRRAVDEAPVPGRFLLTGSATPRDPGTHSGAGRIVRVRMRPLTLAERGEAVPSVSMAGLLDGGRGRLAGRTELGLAYYAREICASGFPGLRGSPARAVRALLDGYLDQIVDRDFPDMNHTVRSPATLRGWMAAYAAATATAASFDAIRDAATPGHADKPARSTTEVYREILERLWILDPVPAWLPTRNQLRRLGAAPKHHLADPALAARLLGADEPALLDAAPAGPLAPRHATLLGQLFESLVALDLRVHAQAAEARVGHLRLHSGEHEIDFIVERGDHRVLAVEVKLSHTVTDNDTRHLHWLASQIGDDLIDAIVVTTGGEAYRRPDGIGVVPAALLGP